MASKTDNSSAFRAVAGVMAVSLIAAAGLLYLQSGQSSGEGTGSALVAVSQALPMQSVQAVDGVAGGFDRLDASLQQLRSLPRQGAPGSRSDWNAVGEHAIAIAGRRDAVGAIIAAADYAEANIPTLMDGADDLLDETSATAVVQQFQQRVASLQRGLDGLTMSDDPASAADAIRADLAFLRQVVDGFSGAGSDLDIAALDSATREGILAPIAGELGTIETRTRAALDNVAALAGLGADFEALTAASQSIFDASLAASGGSALPGFLSDPLIPLGMLGFALILIVVLIALHSKSSVFEKTARVQAAQNERNQQAILRLLDELGSLADGDLTVEATVTEDITGAIADSINYAIEKLRELVATINETLDHGGFAAKQTENTAVTWRGQRRTSRKRSRRDGIDRLDGRLDRRGVRQRGTLVGRGAPLGRSRAQGRRSRAPHDRRHEHDSRDDPGDVEAHQATGRELAGDRQHRRTDQRYRRADQHPGAERVDPGVDGRRGRARFRGGRGRGAAAGRDARPMRPSRSRCWCAPFRRTPTRRSCRWSAAPRTSSAARLLAENAGAALDEIEQVSNQIANLVQNISGSARQQASSAADVTRRTTELKEIGEQTGKATTATAAASRNCRYSPPSSADRRGLHAAECRAENQRAAQRAAPTANGATAATPAPPSSVEDKVAG